MRGLMLGLLLAAAAGPGHGQTPNPAPAPGAQAQPKLPPCAPPKLVYVVTRIISPGMPAAHPAAQPREIWRQGATRLRILDQPSLQTGDQALTIISEPDIWTLNLTKREGQHSVDPGPDLAAHMPILPPAEASPVLGQLEFGCEADFVAAYAPAAERTLPWGMTQASLHRYVEGAQSVSFLMDDETMTPLMVSYLRDGKPVLILRYDAYRKDLPDRPDMFKPPAGMALKEAPAALTTPSD